MTNDPTPRTARDLEARMPASFGVGRKHDGSPLAQGEYVDEQGRVYFSMILFIRQGARS